MPWFFFACLKPSMMLAFAPGIARISAVSSRDSSSSALMRVAFGWPWTVMVTRSIVVLTRLTRSGKVARAFEREITLFIDYLYNLLYNLSRDQKVKKWIEVALR